MLAATFSAVRCCVCVTSSEPALRLIVRFCGDVVAPASVSLPAPVLFIVPLMTGPEIVRSLAAAPSAMLNVFPPPPPPSDTVVEIVALLADALVVTVPLIPSVPVPLTCPPAAPAGHVQVVDRLVEGLEIEQPELEMVTFAVSAICSDCWSSTISAGNAPSPMTIADGVADRPGILRQRQLPGGDLRGSGVGIGTAARELERAGVVLHPADPFRR